MWPPFLPIRTPMHAGVGNARSTTGETLEGTVFTDSDGLLVLEQYLSSNVADSKARRLFRIHAARPPPPATPSPTARSRCALQATYRVLNSACVSDIKVLAEAPARAADAPEAPPIPAVDLELAAAREERAINKAVDENAKVNENATARTQRIFDELSKTMPCEWMENEDKVLLILVLEHVRAPHARA